MSLIPKSRPGVILTAFLIAGGIGSTPSAWRQLLAQTTATPQAGTPRQSGGWHHFGGGASESARTPAPPARQSTSANHIRDLELQMFALLNRDRMDPANAPETRGQAFPLQWNDKLAEVARAHSQNMMSQRFFDHVDPQGRSPAMRIKAIGMDWQAVGENIAIHRTIPGAHAAFMDEPRFRQNHRANVLSAKYTQVGIGIVQGPDGRYYITQDFCAAPYAVNRR